MPFRTTFVNDILNVALGMKYKMDENTPNSSGIIQVWLGLCSNDPEEDKGDFAELSGYGYERVLVNQFNTGIKNGEKVEDPKVEAYPGLIGTASERAIKNTRQIAFTKATGGDWVEAQGYGLFYQKSGGTPFYYTKLKEPVTTPEGAVFLFDPGDMKIDFQTTDVDIVEETSDT